MQTLVGIVTIASIFLLFLLYWQERRFGSKMVKLFDVQTENAREASDGWYEANVRLAELTRAIADEAPEHGQARILKRWDELTEERQTSA